MATTANQPAPSYTSPRKNDAIWNVLTFAVLLTTICLVGLFSLLYFSPQIPINPFLPPAAPAALQQVPTTTALIPGEARLTAAVTSTETTQASSSPTPPPPLEPSPTSAPTFEVTALPAVDSTSPSSEVGLYAFDLRSEPAYIASAIIYPEAGCKWMGVAGQVFDRQGAPLLGVSVYLSGKLQGKAVSLLSLTGTARQYGEAGYEFWLGEQALDTEGELWVQLLDQAQLAISPKMPVSTFSDCEKNLTIMTFRQVR